ncbi:hypothetical protein GW924_00010 [Candidatus Pacearchaeota archaeon]|nr:hypothetical protein [Candidatus Pacearchaeota archaeon]
MERKKRLEKGIESLEKQIEKHKEKIEKFAHEKPWLKDYWQKQIEGFEKEKDRKKRRA